MRISTCKLVDATGAAILARGTADVSGEVTIDSRTVGEGSVFVAFAGERVDGNAYARSAIEAGAALVVASAEVSGDDLAAARERGVSLWAALTDPSVIVPPKLAAFEHLITSMRLQAEKLPLLDAIGYVIKASGLEAAARLEREGEDRVANMQEILSAAKGWLDLEGVALTHPAFAPLNEETPSPMEGFLTQATLEAGDKNEDAGKDAVQLMTVHSAKGLEFPWVWIIGAEEGLFPHFSATKVGGGADGTNRGGLEEERRLMYVAITRAKKHLCFTHCTERMMWGNRFNNPLSSFVEEIPEALLNMRPVSKRRSDWADRRRGDEDDDDGYGRQWKANRFGGSERSGRGFAKGGSWSNGGRSGSSGSSGWSGGRSSGSGSGLVGAVPARSSDSGTGFKAGDAVVHDAFGRGVVKRIVGTGDAAALEVEFAGAKKTLIFKFAKDKMRKAG